MYVSVITTRQPKSIGSGLTYQSDLPLVPGTLVEVPLRKQLTEGIVIASLREIPTGITVKSVARVLGSVPILLAPLLKTALWMCEYYCCLPRQALQVFLPPPPWRNVLPVEEILYAVRRPQEEIRGTKQREVLAYLVSKQHCTGAELSEATGASRATIMSLVKRGILSETRRVPPPETQTPRIPPLPGEEEDLVERIMGEQRPSVLVDGEPGDDRTMLAAALAARTLSEGKSALLLYPDSFSAEAAHRRLEELFGPSLELLHSGTGTAERRRITRKLLLGSPAVIVGTRTALFSPAASLGLVILDSEQEWTWKSEQTPRYHTRLTAEVLCKFSRAKLLLASATPSLEALHHTHAADGEPARYHRIDRPCRSVHTGTVQAIDLTTADFGSSYPITSPLLAALRDRLKRKEASVLLLNRKGTATSLMCFECKRSVLSPLSQLPMSIVTSGGKQMLFDRPTGLRETMPTSCPHCGSLRLKAVGAGTEGTETILHHLLPAARIARADADSLDEPGKLLALLGALERGDLDILIGTRPVLKALSIPRVTLAAVLVADIGLSHPDFRSGERVFTELTRIIARMGAKNGALTIIQTFRPGSPEIACAASGEKEQYWKTELKLRTTAGYPPATQMIRLILRGKDARTRTHTLHRLAEERASSSGTVAAKTEEFEGGRLIGTVTLRGLEPRKLLRELPLRDVSVDVDPAE